MRALLIFLVMCQALAAAQPSPAPSTDEFTSISRQFVSELNRRDFSAASGRFDSAMKRALPEAALANTWQSLTSQTGAFQKELAVTPEQYQQFEIRHVICAFEKATIDIKVVIDRSSKQVSGLFFIPTQPPIKPARAGQAFTEQEVTIGFGDWALPGTLTLPKTRPPFPAVVLVHGSGPQDRDETVGPNKPFRDIAHGLAAKGIAILRYEKRTKAHPTLCAMARPPITVKEETIDDALAAAELLRAHKNIDPKRIFVLGHSLGGMLIPRIAPAGPTIAGFIIMAGTARPLEDVLLEQVTYISSLETSADSKKQLEEIRKQVGRVKALQPGADESQMILGASARYWLDLRSYHPADAAKTIRQPLLILQGGRDYQVTHDDYKLWQDALAGHPNATFKLYPDLNHLFMTGNGKARPAEYNTPNTLSPAVIADIAEWIQKSKL